MPRTHRISAGGLTFRGDTVLLVQYRDANTDQTYWVAPGGRLEEDENTPAAVVRETLEETGVTVHPGRVIALEDLLTEDWKMLKTWLVCEYVSHEVHPTPEAQAEGILSAGWFTRSQLEGLTVFPALLLEYDWSALRSTDFPVLYLPVRYARF